MYIVSNSVCCGVDFIFVCVVFCGFLVVVWGGGGGLENYFSRLINLSLV